MADLSRKTEIQAWAGKTVRAAGNASTYRRGDDSMEVYLR